MPALLRKGGPSRLYLEGLAGEVLDGKIIYMVKPHGAKRRTRTVTFVDGTKKDYSIQLLLDLLVKLKGY